VFDARRARVVLAVLACIACDLGPPKDIVVSEAAHALHRTTPIVNLHADFPMFNRDFSRRSEEGVSDFPRMRGAGIKVLAASICPGGLEMRLAFWWWGWPPEARPTALTRAYAELALVEAHVARDASLRIIRTVGDLDGVLESDALGLLITMEGGDAVADDPSRVREFYARGVRTLELTHLRDNDLGGSGSPTIPGTNLQLHADVGLTDTGRAVLREMAAVGMILDLAHASPKTFDEALAAWRGPVFVSHTAMAAIYPSRRNLSDDQLRAIAARQGIVGISAQRQFLGGRHLDALAEHVVHAVQIAGADHIALGLDMEEVTASVLPPELRDVRDLPRLTELLLARGLRAETIRQVYSGSALEFLRRVLPE
jgi:membrane dipeptidase